MDFGFLVAGSSGQKIPEKGSRDRRWSEEMVGWARNFSANCCDGKTKRRENRVVELQDNHFALRKRWWRSKTWNDR